MFRLCPSPDGGNCRFLILLGNGPQGGQRTLDNPLSFDVKAQFLQDKLAENGHHAGQNYVMAEMRNPAGDAVAFLEAQILEATVPPTRVGLFQVAGEKDDDPTKLAFVGAVAKKFMTEKFPDIVFTWGITTVPAIRDGAADLSATQIRKRAYAWLATHPDQEGALPFFDDFTQGFYGAHSAAIWGQMAEVAAPVPAEDLAHYGKGATRKRRASPPPTKASTASTRRRKK